MEILNSNYNCRNPFVAGLLPITEIEIKHQKEKKLETTMVISLNKENQSNKQKTKKALRNKRQKEAKRKKKRQKHVHFPDQELIAFVIIIEDDDFVKESRNKYWEFFAIDRLRFKNRINEVSKILNKILKPEHRNKIFEERFNENPEKNLELNNNYDLKISQSLKLNNLSQDFDSKVCIENKEDLQELYTDNEEDIESMNSDDEFFVIFDDNLDKYSEDDEIFLTKHDESEIKKQKYLLI